MNKPDRTKFITDVELAAKGFAGVIPSTPLQKNLFLSDRYGANIYLKREDLTAVRSYKMRGAFNFFRKALAADPREPVKFVCASAGNHAQGFAYACQHFNVEGVIFMPVTTPQQKIHKTATFGGDKVSLKFEGDIFDQCNQAAIAYAEREGALLVPPFDHYDVIEGQATVGLEILEQCPEQIDLLMLPIGGGGLAAGVSEVFANLSLDTEIMYVEPKGAPSFTRSLEAGELVKLDKINSFVDGAAVAEMGQLNFEMLKSQQPEQVMLVEEDHLCETIIELLNIEGIVLEPAGALEIDALRYLADEKRAGKTIVCIVSGGNFDFERLPEVKERAMKAAGLKKYFIVRLAQRPGALRELLALLGPEDDIARFEYLKKSARNFGTILMGVETKQADNFSILTDKMTAAGFQFEDITEDENVANFII